MEVMAGEEGGGGGSSQQLTDRSAPPPHPTPSEETHSIYWQIPSSASHYVIHQHGENGDPKQENNDEPRRVFIKTRADGSEQLFSLTGYKDYQVPANSKQCADEAGSSGLSFKQLN